MGIDKRDFIVGVTDKYQSELLEKRREIEGNTIGCIAGDLLLIDDSMLKPTDYVITLEILGHQLDSFGFCDKIESIFNFCSNIVFIIGGSYGLSKEVKERSDFSLSFSKMTFPHQLMRVILLEQIYRAYRIINNEPYHK